MNTTTTENTNNTTAKDNIPSVTTDKTEQAKIIKRLFGILYDLQNLLQDQNLLAPERLKWIDDCLTEIEVGYEEKAPVNAYGETLRSQNFTLTFEEAFDSLMDRLGDSTVFLSNDAAQSSH